MRRRVNLARNSGSFAPVWPKGRVGPTLRLVNKPPVLDTLTPETRLAALLRDGGMPLAYVLQEFDTTPLQTALP
jgi:hypothetical protein